MSPEVWFCWSCRRRFTLTGSAPRLTLTAVVLTDGTDRTVIPATGAITASLCPECSADHAAALTAMEQAAQR